MTASSGAHHALRTLLAIPVYNEALHLPAVLDGVLRVIDAEDLLILDDGSSDDTRHILQGRKLRFIAHPTKQGKGTCLLRAIRYAQELEYDWLLCMDGDGQHDPDDLPRFLQHIQKGDADVILANRIRRAGHMPLLRRCSNQLSSMILSLLIHPGKRIKDSQCGFRALRLSALRGQWFSTRGFQFESEVLLVLGRRGCRIEQIPIRTEYGGQASQVQPLRDTLAFVRLVLKSVWNR